MSMFQGNAKDRREDAAKWLADGHSVYVYWLSHGIMKVKNGPHAEMAEMIEDIESVGWRLDQVVTTSQMAAFNLIFRKA